MNTADLYGTCDVCRQLLALAASGKLPGHFAADFDSQHCDGSYDYPVYPMRRGAAVLGPAGIAAYVAAVTDQQGATR